MITYKTVLDLKYPNLGWTIANETDYDTIVWPEGIAKPTKEYLDQLIIDETDIQSTETERAAIQNRIKQYPDITDQLDMLWHDMNNGTIEKASTFYEAIKAIKDANPKS
jgi:hypothetical protein